MFSQHCIDNSIPFARFTDTVGYALEIMQENKTDRLPVVEDGYFKGIITENILLECDDFQRLDFFKEHLLAYKLTEDTHLFDVLKKSTDLSTFFIPIVNSKDEYIGITSPQRILTNITQNSLLSTSGGILVLELEARNYSLTEISKIVESNNAMVVFCMVSTTTNSGLLQVSLKINKNDLKDIQASFERYQYSIIAVFHQSEFEQQLQERYDSLMRYLEI